VFLQEAMDFVPRPESEQPPDLRFGEFAGTIAFQRQSLKGRSRDAGSTGFQVSRDILGQVERDLHRQFLDLIVATGVRCLVPAFHLTRMWIAFDRQAVIGGRAANSFRAERVSTQACLNPKTAVGRPS
jgi:hypothetical protein